MNSPYTLNRQLIKDTYAVLETPAYWLRLHKNALVPWLIIVPKTEQIELIDCANDLKENLYALIDLLGDFLRSHYHVDKLNIATLGNVVSQLHIHVVGRYHHDFAWPDPVWGKAAFQAYSNSRSDKMIAQLQRLLTQEVK